MVKTTRPVTGKGLRHIKILVKQFRRRETFGRTNLKDKVKVYRSQVKVYRSLDKNMSTKKIGVPS